MGGSVAYIPVFSNVSYALPLFILAAASLLWWWRSRPQSPPYLTASPPYHSWRINPVAAAHAALREDRYLLAAFLLRERLASVAQELYGVSPEELRTWAASGAAPKLPSSVSLRRVLRDLAAAYRSAYLADGARSWEAFSSVTVPMRRRRAARDFDRAVVEVEQVLAAWGAAA